MIPFYYINHPYFLQIPSNVFKNRPCSKHLGPNTPMTKRNIMAAIVRSMGPVSTHQVIKHGWRFLRMITLEQFLVCAQALEAANLGTILNHNPNRNKPVYFFIKKAPSAVIQELLDNPDLCTPDLYAERFCLPTPNLVSATMRIQIAATGLVRMEQFEGSS